MSMEITTFRLDKDYKRKLRAEPKKNRYFNDMSEILVMMVRLYFNDPSFKRKVIEGAKQYYKEFYDLDNSNI